MIADQGEKSCRNGGDGHRGGDLAAVDSDGEDGSTDVAGAIVDADAIVDSSAARAAFDENDVTLLLDSLGGTIRTGPTGTNVDDIHVVVPDSEL